MQITNPFRLSGPSVSDSTLSVIRAKPSKHSSTAATDHSGSTLNPRLQNPTVANAPPTSGMRGMCVLGTIERVVCAIVCRISRTSMRASQEPMQVWMQ